MNKEKLSLKIIHKSKVEKGAKVIQIYSWFKTSGILRFREEESKGKTGESSSSMLFVSTWFHNNILLLMPHSPVFPEVAESL